MTIYTISAIADGYGSWPRCPDGQWNSLDEALAAGRAYVDEHINEGEYGQSPISAVEVEVFIDIVELDANGDELDKERHSYFTSVGGDVGVSDRAAELYDRICATRYIVHIDDDDRAAADELVENGLAHWVSGYMSEDEPGLRPGSTGTAA